ncbi:MAG: 2,3-cyclic 3-phosphodiesterase [Acidobacteriota bacterium]|jgi:2'-5' RNA ligase|nr:2,3-cyclic 3-phosphodiesterase [Acidobacteriota bacterium]
MRDEEKKKRSRSAFIPHPSSLIPSLARVFCAVELPLEVRARAAEHIARLRDAVQGVRASWEREEKLHITLKFLGEIAPNRLQALSDAASHAALSTQPFILSLEGAGAFPTRGLPRILWLSINDSSGQLTKLQSNLEEECEHVGFAREERPFRPHLTIARIRAPQAARKLAQLHQEIGFEAIDFPVKELVLMRSELGPGGSSYTEISRHRLKKEVSE